MYRILHIDDDALMRDIVDAALGLDPAFALMSCTSGDEGLMAAPGWAPNLIICDVIMPHMDGPEVLARLRADKTTAKIPVVFMTAFPKQNETERWISLGAAAVIAKPFDPAQFADAVRNLLRTIKLASAGYDFAERLRADAVALAAFRNKLRTDACAVPDGLQSCAHKLAGAAGVFHLKAVSRSASALEEAIIEQRAGRGAPEAIAANLDALLDCIQRE